MWQPFATACTHPLPQRLQAACILSPPLAWQIGRAELLVKTKGGAMVKVDMRETPELYTVNPQIENDMTSLWYLHEPGILDNLRGRFVEDQPYT